MSDEAARMGAGLRAQVDDGAPPVMSPPIVPGAIGAPERAPAWPLVVGIIAITLGSLGALVSAYGMAGPWLMPKMEALSPRGPVDVFGPLHRWQWALFALNALGLLLAAALMTGGIGLVCKRVWSARVLMVWAMVRVPCVLALIAITVLMQQEQLAAMRTSSAGASAAIGSAVGMVIGVVAIAFMLAWYLALPVFVLIWFRKARVRGLIARWQPGGIGTRAHG